jgi:hypothetical protein
MRLSSSAIAKLQKLFSEEYGVLLSDEEAQQTGLKIVRYVYAKELNKQKTVPEKAKDI